MPLPRDRNGIGSALYPRRSDTSIIMRLRIFFFSLFNARDIKTRSTLGRRSGSASDERVLVSVDPKHSLHDELQSSSSESFSSPSIASDPPSSRPSSSLVGSTGDS